MACLEKNRAKRPFRDARGTSAAMLDRVTSAWSLGRGRTHGGAAMSGRTAARVLNLVLQ